MTFHSSESISHYMKTMRLSRICATSHMYVASENFLPQFSVIKEFIMIFIRIEGFHHHSPSKFQPILKTLELL